MSPKNSHPTDPVFVIEVRAVYDHKEMGSGIGSSGAKTWVTDGLFKSADIPAIAAGIKSAVQHASEYLDDTKPKDVLRGWKYDRHVEIEFWYGPRSQFEPRPSDNKVLWSDRGNKGAKVLTSRTEITEEDLRKALNSLTPPAPRKQAFKP